MSLKTTNNNPEYIRIAVLRTTHSEIKSFLKEQGDGGDIGKFYDKAAMEKIKILKEKNSLWGKFNSQTLISNGFSKSGNYYKRGSDIVKYTGAYWFYNDILMDENNYRGLIYDKMKAKL